MMFRKYGTHGQTAKRWGQTEEPQIFNVSGYKMDMPYAKTGWKFGLIGKVIVAAMLLMFILFLADGFPVPFR